MIRMIQVEGLKLQPCPTLFSESLAPSVSHFGDESNDLRQLLASDPSLCSIFDAESLLRRVHQQLQQMKLEWNSKSIMQYPQKVQSWESWACNLWISNDWLLNTVSLYSIWSYRLYCLCFTWSQGYAAEVSLYSINNRAFASHVLNAQRRLFSGRLFPHYQVDLTSHQFKMRLNHWIPKQKNESVHHTAALVAIGTCWHLVSNRDLLLGMVCITYWKRNKAAGFSPGWWSLSSLSRLKCCGGLPPQCHRTVAGRPHLTATCSHAMGCLANAHVAVK